MSIEEYELPEVCMTCSAVVGRAPEPIDPLLLQSIDVEKKRALDQCQAHRAAAAEVNPMEGDGLPADVPLVQGMTPQSEYIGAKHQKMGPSESDGQRSTSVHLVLRNESAEKNVAVEPPHMPERASPTYSAVSSDELSVGRYPSSGSTDSTPETYTIQRKEGGVPKVHLVTVTPPSEKCGPRSLIFHCGPSRSASMTMEVRHDIWAYLYLVAFRWGDRDKSSVKQLLCSLFDHEDVIELLTRFILDGGSIDTVVPLPPHHRHFNVVFDKCDDCLTWHPRRIGSA